MTTPHVHILLVEDNPGDVLLVRKALEEVYFHHHLAVAEDGVEALHYLLRKPPYQDAPRPDVIILDLNLPRISGQELIERLATMPEFSQIPLVVLTSSPQDQYVLDIWPAGRSLYLIKPVSFSELRDRMAEAMDFLASIHPKL